MFEAEKPAEPEREAVQESDLGSLAQSDSLRLYLREISRIPLLSATRESSLAERAESGDKTARNQLIEANLGTLAADHDLIVARNDFYCISYRKMSALEGGGTEPDGSAVAPLGDFAGSD